MSRHLRGLETLRHPGHMLLVFTGLGAALDGLVELAIQLAVWWNWSDVQSVNGYLMHHVTFVYHQTIGYAIITVIGVWMIRAFPWPVRWTVGFATLWLTFVFQFLTHCVVIAVIYQWAPDFILRMYIPEHCMLVGSLSCVAIFTCAVVGDRRISTGRDWPHWCGLLLSLLLSTFEWIRYIRILTNYSF
ncbi:MAG: hypothetical protein ACI9HK_004920 [Pirellulaceae bacterium]